MTESILPMTYIREARVSDRTAILSVAETCGLFGPEEIDVFSETFDDWRSDDPDDPRLWLLAEGEPPPGAAFLAPEIMSDNVWNLLFIGIRPERQRGGVGRALFAAAEARARAAGGRMLLVDTVSGEEMAGARAFYRAQGYDQVATISGYYGDGADRVTFARRL